ncbi:LuxR C-terminal-related transcriptional regulator [Treponema sp.]|uniref:LuxR C-terminal-related transcriptional regulator n=1 Tax=Treponema sp. TaxID=166 RepID=UPI00298EA08E|nr:LuxR C-terminal-related transcriptional regulator [Treponema sp.]MCR5613389.1 LuxR C-terminal-related transcriptional regulator [Treponema sp.]
MAEQFLSAEELQNRVFRFTQDYYFVGMRKDRDLFYALTSEDIQKYPVALCGVVLNLFMDGELKKADEFLDNLPKNDLFDAIKLGMKVVHPEVTWKEFIKILDYLKKNNLQLTNVALTAGRPSLLNGFNDFTRIGPFLEKRKMLFLEDLACLYEKSMCPAIYNLCLSEYYYQLNRLIDAEVLVSRTIKEFDRDSERRLLFASLYLQAKILIAYGKIVDAESYIKNIRNYVKKNGEAEFSYNIDAAEVLIAFYEGNHELINRWMKNKAPDEFADFNMIDVYRYMVKMRCYIVQKKYTAVVALAEKLRPLLEAGKRHMDLCEMDLLLAITFYRAQKKELAFEALERTLKIARRRKFYRLIGDEGDAVLHLLLDYMKEKGESEFLMLVYEIARGMAISHPLYLTSELKNKTMLTQKEVDILKLLEQGKPRDEIAELFFISENTVNFHMKNIYSKLEVSSVTQAVWNARVLGII